ncbi:unnamed protein product [Brassica rapa subsp. trilocularis]
MDSVSGYAGPRQPRTGGKIVRPRRTSVVRTPYDRPAPRSRDPPQQNPSWISRLVYKPATAIASGAGKFISSVVFSESSSSSSEGEDSSSDIEGDEDVEKNITEFAEDETMDLVNAQQSTIQRLGSKRVIEQLLMQETFAREEGDRLIDIIKARVVDHPSALASNEGRHSDNGLTSEVNAGEMSSKAVMEAKRWLEEKKSASNSKSKATEDGAGSPVDVARSYMRSRLPLGSPAANPPPPPPDEPRSKVLEERCKPLCPLCRGEVTGWVVSTRNNVAARKNGAGSRVLTRSSASTLSQSIRTLVLPRLIQRGSLTGRISSSRLRSSTC